MLNNAIAGLSRPATELPATFGGRAVAILGASRGPGGTRLMTGLKLHRITGPGEHKKPYDPERAEERARVHAAHFTTLCVSLVFPFFLLKFCFQLFERILGERYISLR